MSNNLVIQTKGLTKTFGSFVAVNGIDIEVVEGSIHGFIGPNGAGKTTTIKMLIGATRCTRGEGYIRAYPIGSIEARRLIGYAPEHASFYREMTSLQYLVYMAMVCGIKKQTAEEKARDLLDWVELGKFTNTRVGGFSAGMRQRLALVQALIHDPEVIILDEPTANLDPTGRMSIIDKLKQISQERQTTIFISSHILSELEQLVDSVTLINGGQIAAEDGIHNLKRRFGQNHFLLNTSENESILQAICSDSCIEEAWIGEDGFIHILSNRADDLKHEVVKAIFRNGVLLDYFGEEKVSLEDVYRKTMNLESK